MPDIQLPEEVTQARQKASDLLGSYGSVASADSSVGEVLRQKVYEAYSQNQDVINSLDKSTATYYAAPAAARLKYQDIFNPAQKEALVSEYTANEAVPMLGQASILGNRMGRISDLIGSGTNAFKAVVDKAKFEYDQARQNYQDILDEYKTSFEMGRETKSDDLAREKFEWDKSHSGRGTASERLEPTTQQAINDARNGWTLTDLQGKYGAKLGSDEVVRIYGANTKYGEPTENYARKILGLEPSEETSKSYTPWYKKAAAIFGIY